MNSMNSAAIIGHVAYLSQICLSSQRLCNQYSTIKTLTDHFEFVLKQFDTNDFKLIIIKEISEAIASGEMAYG